MIFKARNLLWNKSHSSNATMNKEGYWVPCRGENHRFAPIWDNIKGAFFVLIGKYDAIDWEND